MNELQTLSRVELTKDSIALIGQQLAQDILDLGEVAPLDAYIKLRAIKEAVDAAIKTMESDAIDEVRGSGGDGKLHNVGFRVQGGHEMYDFSADSYWKRCDEAIKLWTEERKKREGFLKSLTKEMVDPDTGEIVEPATIKGYTKVNLAITFPKS